MSSSRLQRVLIVVDRGFEGAYLTALGPLDYSASSLYDEWERQKPKKYPTGPFNRDFVKDCMRQSLSETDLILVDYNCADLAQVIREAGYKGPIIGITTFSDEKQGTPYIRMSRQNEDIFMGRPMKGADVSVGLLPSDTFSQRLREAAQQCRR